MTTHEINPPPVYLTEDLKSAAPGHEFGDLVGEAEKAATSERNMSLMQGIRLYPKAVGWSVLISTCIVMEGYGVCLLSNFYGFPAFNRKYGELQLDGTYSISAQWQAGLSNGANVGGILGLMLNGWLSEKIGYRYTVMGTLIAMAAFTAISFTAQNLQTLLVFEILCGIPWGIFQTLTITYASEVCPIALRGYLTTYVNCCWGIGQLIGIGVIKSMLSRTDEWSYRIPFGLQWMWIAPLFIGVALAPESPWWLVRKGRMQDARHSILRLTSLNRETNFNADETIAMMQHTIMLESKINSGTRFIDCFKGADLRRTEIVCMVWAMQNLSGNSFSGYSSYFFQKAGLDPSTSYSFAMGQYAINCVGCFAAWGLMSFGLGRRTLFFNGLIGLCIMLFILGCLGFVPAAKRDAAAFATGGVMLGWAVVYQCTVGTIAYSLVGEIPSRRLLIKTVVLGRALYNVVGIVCSVLTPYQLNETAWNWGNKAGFFWAGSCFLCIIWTYFRLPEPTGRSFAELDLLFEQGVSARKFGTTTVDVFGADNDSDRNVSAAVHEKKPAGESHKE